MIDLHGNWETAKVFTDICEEEAIAQIRNLLNQEFMKDTHPRFMPDVHAGKGCVVGTTMRITDKKQKRSPLLQAQKRIHSYLPSS